METKSAGILGVCIIIAALIVSLMPRGLPWAATTATESGRYQLIKATDNNVFLLDTKAGRLWQRFVASTSGPSDWSESAAPWMEKTGK